MGFFAIFEVLAQCQRAYFLINLFCLAEKHWAETGRKPNLSRGGRNALGQPSDSPCQRDELRRLNESVTKISCEQGLNIYSI